MNGWRPFAGQMAIRRGANVLWLFRTTQAKHRKDVEQVRGIDQAAQVCIEVAGIEICQFSFFVEVGSDGQDAGSRGGVPYRAFAAAFWPQT